MCLQADLRFRDSVATLDELGFHLEGMPSTAPRHPDGAADADQAIVDAQNDLTQVAPFLEAAVDGERQHERGRHFASDYRRILDDAEHGFYWVLCQLHRLRFAVGGVSGARRTIPTTLPGVGEKVQSNAIRHYRDYVVLRDFGRLLDVHRHQLWHRHARSRAVRGASQV